MNAENIITPDQTRVRKKERMNEYMVDFNRVLQIATPTITEDEMSSVCRFLIRMKTVTDRGSTPLALLRGNTLMQLIRGSSEIGPKITPFVQKIKELLGDTRELPSHWNKVLAAPRNQDVDLALELSEKDLDDVRTTLGFGKSLSQRLENNMSVTWNQRIVTGSNNIQHATVVFELSSGSQLMIDVFPVPYENPTDGRLGTGATINDIARTCLVSEGEGGKLYVRVSPRAQNFAFLDNTPAALPGDCINGELSLSGYINSLLRALRERSMYLNEAQNSTSILGVLNTSLFGASGTQPNLRKVVADLRHNGETEINERKSEIMKYLLNLLFIYGSRNDESLSLFLSVLHWSRIINFFPSMKQYLNSAATPSLNFVKGYMLASQADQQESNELLLCEFATHSLEDVIRSLLYAINSGTATPADAIELMSMCDPDSRPFNYTELFTGATKRKYVGV